MNVMLSVIEPSLTLTAKFRFRYKYTPPLHVIQGTEAEKREAMARIRIRYARAIATMKSLASRNREKPDPRSSEQEYYCIGCDVGDGELRDEIFDLPACPILQVAMQEELGEQLTLQCYFPQTYESIAGMGPGGIIGTIGWGTPDTSAARCWNYVRWVSDNQSQPRYTSEKHANVELWKDTFRAYSRGKHWLMNLPEKRPRKGIKFPKELKHELIPLLGVPAQQRLVTKHLGRDLVLLDNHRVIERKHLHWALVA